MTARNCTRPPANWKDGIPRFKRSRSLYPVPLTYDNASIDSSLASESKQIMDDDSALETHVDSASQLGRRVEPRKEMASI
jgi:hypothetical protein